MYSENRRILATQPFRTFLGKSLQANELSLYIRCLRVGDSEFFARLPISVIGFADGPSWIGALALRPFGAQFWSSLAVFILHFFSFWFRICWLVPGKVVFVALDVFLF